MIGPEVDTSGDVYYCLHSSVTIDRKQLRRYRTFAGLSIRQLAAEAGISHSHLAFIEKGQRTAREGVTKKLADALGISMEDIMIDNE